MQSALRSSGIKIGYTDLLLVSARGSNPEYQKTYNDSPSSISLDFVPDRSGDGGVSLLCAINSRVLCL